MSELTNLFKLAQAGDENTTNRLFAALYDELKTLARRRNLANGQHTLGTTGLVHECYLRFLGADAQPNDRQHFFALAARVMRQVLIDYARRRLAGKRGGGADITALDHVLDVPADDAQDLVELDDLLNRLGVEHERRAKVVECRVFAGFTEEETAETLGVSVRTVQLDWHEARDWLAKHGTA
jgi:RNA polymerase sigma factor (TIGR02999 family)